VTLFQQGDRIEQLFLIEEGFVKLTVTSMDGSELIVGLRMSGWLLGAGSAVMGRKLQTTAQTITRCRLRPIAVATFNRVREDPAISAWLHRMQAREWLDQVALMRLLGGRGPQQRVEGLLVTLARASHSVRADGAIRLTLPLRHYEMAQMVNLSPEHFSRVLGTLETASVIRRDKGWLIIPLQSPLFRILALVDDF
jgi:CRP-like cAMP-binding protein